MTSPAKEASFANLEAYKKELARAATTEFGSGWAWLVLDAGKLKKTPYGIEARLENGKGTNPEELIGAAHAGCFSMAFALMLGDAGLTATKIKTHAAVTLEKIGASCEITASHLTVSANVPGADDAKFQEIANQAKAGCPVSKLLKAQITMDAKLKGCSG